MWCASRAGYRRDHWLAVLGSLGASCLIGLVWGYRDLASGRRIWLELHSVGHVNHSAIYLAIITVGALGLLAAYWRSFTGAWRLTGLAGCAFFGSSLMVMASRGAFGAAALTVLLLGLGWWRRSRALAITLLVAIGVIAGATVLLPSPVAEKNRVTVEAVGVLSRARRGLGKRRADLLPARAQPAAQHARRTRPGRHVAACGGAPRLGLGTAARQTATRCRTDRMDGLGLRTVGAGHQRHRRRCQHDAAT